MDLLRKLARAGQSKTNACRNLHRLINKNGVLFPVKIDATLISVAFRRPALRVEKLWWPLIRMDAWVRSILEQAPELLLCGHRLSDQCSWQSVFSSFWDIYFTVNPEHVLRTAGFDLAYCISYFFHGDEGRGFRNRRVVVEAFQPVISWKGIGSTNESGHLGID